VNLVILLIDEYGSASRGSKRNEEMLLRFDEN
jgi:hypothetical protein